MIAINLSKQQVLGADPRTIQYIKFTGNVDQAGDATTSFVLEKAKETVLYF